MRCSGHASAKHGWGENRREGGGGVRRVREGLVQLAVLRPRLGEATAGGENAARGVRHREGGGGKWGIKSVRSMRCSGQAPAKHVGGGD